MGQDDREFATSQSTDIRQNTADYQPSVIPTTDTGIKDYVNTLYNKGVKQIKVWNAVNNGMSGLNTYLLSFDMWNPER